MSAFLKKSQNNIVVAEILIDNKFALSSAHSAYYSVFLLIKYMLAHNFSLSYAQQDELTRNGKDSHKILSDRALECMATQDQETGSDYFVWYNKLKMMRKKADYKPVEIDDSLLMTNLTTAKDFMKSVDVHFISLK